MAQKIRHRGPDWSGIYVGGSAILAHERLSIVDPQSGGQPLYSPDRKQVLAVNGEIYNHRDIRAKYAGKYNFQTGSDCEVILALYKDKGIHFLEDISGIFAFVLYDEEKDEFLIARDPIGVIPLYIGKDKEGKIYFGSELKALEGFCDEYEIFLPGHYFYSKEGKMKRWYSRDWTEYETVKENDAQTVDVKIALEEAVHRQLMSDVPYGVLLSGGLDSSVISAIAKKYAAKRIETDGASDAWWPQLHSFAIGLKGAGYAAQSEATAMAASLGLPQEVMGQQLGTLSGGQRRRIELARILFSDADTLILDEPTNHLDADSIEWLRGYLKKYEGGFLVISHSTELLDEVVNKVWHLDAQLGQIDMYSLGWKAYLHQRVVDEERRRREREVAEKKAERLMQQGIRLHAKATKAVAAQNMMRRAEKLLENTSEAQKQEKVADIRFPEPAPCGRTPIMAKDVSKAYGSNIVFAGVNLAIDKGSRVVILGYNGAGKTTTLRLLAHLEEPDTGSVDYGHGCKIGYFAQEHDTLDLNATVLENLIHVAPELNDTQARSILGSFLFSGDDALKPARVLSGGEKTRLALATLVTSRANVLLLDEPTNNLDPASRDEILKAIAKYEGAIVLVTHDEGAVQALNPERVLLMPDGDEDLWNDSYLELVAEE